MGFHLKTWLLKKDNKKASDIPSDVQILKDMVISQRTDLTKRDDEIDRLTDKIEEIIIEYEKQQPSIGQFSSDNNEELIKAKKIVVQLSEENEKLNLEKTELKKELEEKEKNKPDIEKQNDVDFTNK